MRAVVYKLPAPPPTDLVVRTRWYVHIRWFVLLAIAVPGIMSLYIGEGWSEQVRRDVTLGAAALGSNVVFFLLSLLKDRHHYYLRLARLILLSDILIIAALIFTKGGIESRSPILFVLPILLSAALLGRSAIYKTALLSILIYDALIVADYYNLIQSVGALNPNLRESYTYMLNSVAFFSSVLLILAVATDYIMSLLIAKEKQASDTSEALKRAQAIAQLGSWEWDLQTNSGASSEEMYRMFGVDQDDTKLDVDKFLNRIHPDDRMLVEAQFAAAIKNKASFSFDHRIILPDKSVRFLHSEGQVTPINKGKSLKMYGTAHDITDARVLDHAKEEFVSLASHQLRTPATSVKVYLSMLQEGYAGSLNEAQRDLLDQAHGSNERQIRIINDLLSVASVESGKVSLDRTHINLCSFLEEVAAEHRTALSSADQKLVCHIPRKAVTADIDTARFRMILDNLISNASKYSRRNGTIEINLTARKGAATIAIRDDGIGIAKKDIARLFTKFSRLENKRNANIDGTGLGLYLAKYMTELHGGTISVESKPGQGSTFTIHLPVIQKKLQLPKNMLSNTHTTISSTN